MFLSIVGFKRGIKRKMREGYPISSIRGIDEVLSNLIKIKRLAQAMFLAILSSIVLFYISVTYGLVPLFYVALGLVLIGFGLTILLKQPKEPALEVAGGLMEYYTPVEYPVYIDNMFGDTVSTVFDPLTWMKYDDWVDDVRDSIIVPKDLDPQTALERAIEKIFLMCLLRKEFPTLIKENVVDEEISEVIREDRLDFILKHRFFGKKKIYRILKRLKDVIPEIYTIVDRLFLTLRDNLSLFKESNLFVESVVSSEVIGLSDTRILVYMFNNSDEFKYKPRPVSVFVVAPGFEPDRMRVDLNLDPKGEFNIEEKELPIYTSEGRDIVGVLR